MKNFLKRIWLFLQGRSRGPAAGSTLPNTAYGVPAGSGQQAPFARPVDVCHEETVIPGLDYNTGTFQSVSIGPDGEYRRVTRHVNIMCGCGRIIYHNPAQTQPTKEKHKLGLKLEGICFYCIQDHDPLVLSGVMSPAEAKRLSLVCSDCARVTVSGKLACRKHTEAITDETGQTIFLGPDDQIQYQRQKTLHRFTGILAFLITEESTPEHKSNDTSDK